MDTQVFNARVLAFEYHANQKYGKEPYTVHLEAVAEMVGRLQDGDPDPYAEAVAWLHDVLEDTPMDEVTLRRWGYAPSVVEAVVLLTKEDDYDYGQYISRIRENPLALLVKKADTLCNLTESVKSGRIRGIKKYTKQLQLLEGIV